MSTIATAQPTTTVLSGKSIPVSTFDTIELSGLEKGDKSVIERLVASAKNPGWFYLDLKDSSVEKPVLGNVDRVYQMSDEYFMQPKDVKDKDARDDNGPSQDRGFETSSCDETFEMQQDEVDTDTHPWPSTMKGDVPMLKEFTKGCNDGCRVVLQRLAESLNEDYLAHHRPGEGSDSGLKLIYEPSLERLADVGDNLHTDSGTMTFLFYDKWGLSAHAPSQGFAFTEPLKGTSCLINIGDSLQRLSGGKLLSPRHRVTQPVDGAEKRYYLSYFLRPEHATKEAWAKDA